MDKANIDRRDFLKLAGAGAVVGSLGLTGREAEAQVVKPNIALINLDDAPDWMLKADFAPKIIERLAQTGIRFKSAYANVPQCGPMRSLTLSGRYNHQDDQPPWNDVAYEHYRQIASNDSLPVVMQRLGYRTGMFGKFMNGYGPYGPEISPGWSKWFAWMGGDGSPWQASENGTVVTGTAHKDYTAFQKAKTWLDGGDQTKPWFAYINPTGPHNPYPDDEAVTPLADRRGLYTNLTWDTPAHDEKGALLQDSPYLAGNGDYTQAERDDALNHVRGKAREIRVVDDLVNNFINKVIDRGELANTLFIVTSDNGYLMGEYGGMSGKHEPYIQASRIPLIFSGAGVGVQWWNIYPLVGHIDLAPTIVKAGGYPGPTDDPSNYIPPRYDGRPLQPILDDGIRPDWWRDEMLIEQDHYGWKAMIDRHPTYGERLYIRRENEVDELYNLDNDPFTRDNNYQIVNSDNRQEFESRLTALVNCQGDTCRLREKY